MSEPQENQRPKFAHPAEEKFARILDYYGIDWEYEPKIFPLEWDLQIFICLIKNFISN